MRRASIPLVSGRTFRRSTMPKKQVVQYTCDRCSRVWYLDSTAPEPDATVRLAFNPSSSKSSTLNINYDCLCDSCADTVTSLVKSLAPLKPREKRAKKKDEASTGTGSAGQGNPQPTDPDATTTDAAPAAQQRSAPASSPPAPSSAGASSGGAGRPPAPASAPHPKR